MKIEGNLQATTGPSQSDVPANKDSAPTTGAPDAAELDKGEPPSSTEHLLAYQSLMDPAGAKTLAAQLGPFPEKRNQRIAALQKAIAEGTFDVSPGQTAEAILFESKVRNGNAA
jgi:anti-sigma28 factor (negative regulator of flagellin synthesis)